MQKRLPSSLPVTSAILYYRKLVWSQAEGYLDFLEEFFTSQVSVRLWTALRYKVFTSEFVFKTPRNSTKPGCLCLGFTHLHVNDKTTANTKMTSPEKYSLVWSYFALPYMLWCWNASKYLRESIYFNSVVKYILN